MRRNQSVMLLAVLLVGICAYLTPQAEAAAILTPKVDLIAFGSTHGLWTVWGDGSHLRLLLADPWPNDPAWSPDGRYVAFARYDQETGQTSLWVIEVKQKTLYPITEDDTSYYFPSWSPDGELLYAGTEAGRIVSIDVSDLSDPGDPEYVTDPPAGTTEWSPACGPDGRIAYCSTHLTEPLSVWVFDPETETDEQVIQGVMSYPILAPSLPSWSPDGESLVFLNNLRPAGANEITIAPVDDELPNYGTAVAYLYDRIYRPVWSQTGRWIYFVKCEPYFEGQAELYRVSTNGGVVTRIVSVSQVGGIIFNTSVTWSPMYPRKLR